METPNARPARERVVVVASDSDFAESISEMLEAAEYEAQPFGSVEAALKALSAPLRAPAAVILHAHCADAKSSLLSQRLKSTPQLHRVPLIVLADVADSVSHLGPTVALKGPVSIDDLIDTLDRLVPGNAMAAPR